MNTLGLLAGIVGSMGGMFVSGFCLGIYWSRNPPKPSRLSKEAQDARRPLPPGVLASALQDRCHRDTGTGRPARSVRVLQGGKK